MEGRRVEEDKKNSTRLGAHLIFIDESGFMLTPSVRRTWAPRGQTPILRHHFSKDRISVISGISVSPTGRRLGLYGMYFWDNIGQEEVALFLREVLRHLRGHVFALLDNSNTHRGGPVSSLCHNFPRLHLQYFPPYAPELNPEEAVWGMFKGNLANGRPSDVQTLAAQLCKEFKCLARSQSKLKGCIRQSELPFLFE